MVFTLIFLLVARYASNSQAQTVVRMTLLELLNQLDDFESKSYELNNVKVILATSKIDSVEPALLRPGQIDGKIELPLPNKSAMRHIFLVLFFFFFKLSHSIRSLVALISFLMQNFQHITLFDNGLICVHDWDSFEDRFRYTLRR